MSRGVEILAALALLGAATWAWTRSELAAIVLTAAAVALAALAWSP